MLLVYANTIGLSVASPLYSVTYTSVALAALPLKFCSHVGADPDPLDVRT